MSQQFTVDDVLQTIVRDPISYYHGESCRKLLTAWDGQSIDVSKLKLAQVHLSQLIQLMSHNEETQNAIK